MKKQKLPKVWIVHKNWTVSNKHHVNTPRKTYNVKSLAQAKAKASTIAMKNKMDSYEMENASGKWVKVKLVTKKKKKVRRQRNPFNDLFM